MAANYVVFRGVSTATMTGVEVMTMPSHKKAPVRYTAYKIKGRDGVLHVAEGFDEIELEVRLILVNAIVSTRQIVDAWADGTGKLYTSDDTTKCYEASVLEEVRWTRDMVGGKFYDVADIIFTCQPYMREVTESSIAITGGTNDILNLGNVTAYPLIKVTGSGNCTFTFSNTGTVTLTGVTSGTPVYIDCENGYVYTEAGGLAATMSGEFPEIPVDGVTVTIGGGTTRLDITPRWGWV